MIQASSLTVVNWCDRSIAPSLFLYIVSGCSPVLMVSKITLFMQFYCSPLSPAAFMTQKYTISCNIFHSLSLYRRIKQNKKENIAILAIGILIRLLVDGLSKINAHNMTGLYS